MFVDACAIISIMANEETAAAYQEALRAATDPFTSPLAVWEAVLVISRPDQLNCPFSRALPVVTQ